MKKLIKILSICTIGVTTALTIPNNVFADDVKEKLSLEEGIHIKTDGNIYEDRNNSFKENVYDFEEGDNASAEKGYTSGEVINKTQDESDIFNDDNSITEDAIRKFQDDEYTGSVEDNEDISDEYVDTFEEKTDEQFVSLNNSLLSSFSEDRAAITGQINALIVRLGFKDYPAGSSNPNYEFYNDEYLKSLYEGKNDGFGLPYNGLSDYLHTSSYGALSMNIGQIIDIQMDETIDYYLNEYDQIRFFENEEFVRKLTEKVNISDFDSNNDGAIDAIYIWNLCDEISDYEGGYTGGTLESEGYSMHGLYACIQLPAEYKDDVKAAVNVLIHETGHLLLRLEDYYLLDGYPEPGGRADIGNIMGWALDGEMGDFDGWSKYKGGWLTNENISFVPLQETEGEIELTPYDSDGADGKKLAFIKNTYVDTADTVAVDYCGGINNNNFDTDLRKTGFRIYNLDGLRNIKNIVHDNDPNLAPEGIYFSPKDKLGAYQLFTEGDEAELQLLDDSTYRLKIYDIHTGDNPSFKYKYYDKFENSNNLSYNIYFTDEEGRTIFDEDFSISDSIHFEIENQPDSDIFNSKNESGRWPFQGRSEIHYYSSSVKDIITKIKNIEVPEGYKEISDIQLKFSNDKLSVMGSDESNIEIDDTYAPTIYFIKIKVEREPVEDDTELDENYNQNFTDKTSEETTEPSGESVPNGTETESELSEEAKKQEIDNEKTTILSKEEGLMRTINKNISGNYSEASLVLPITKEPVKQINNYPTTNQAPKTGDNRFTTVWIVVAGASAGVLTTVVALRKKKEN